MTLLKTIIIAGSLSFLILNYNQSKPDAHCLVNDIVHINDIVILDSAQVIKNGPGGVLMLYAKAKFEASDASVRYEISQHDSRKERYNYHLDITLFDDNKNVVATLKTKPYQTIFTAKDAESYWVNFKGEITSMEKSKSLLVKSIKVSIATN